MKKILIITYYWPPAGGPGVQRILKFVKYLPQFGWEPIVLTVNSPESNAVDMSLQKDISSHCKVFRTKTLEPFAIYKSLNKTQSVSSFEAYGKKKSFVGKVSKWIRSNLFVPDARVGWRFFAVKKAKEIIEQYQPEVILTTGPPQSVHLIGKSIRKKTDVKWVADFRDPWYEMTLQQELNRTFLSDKWDRILEKSVLNNSDIQISVSPSLVKKLNSKQTENKCKLIYNGYDSDDLTTKSKSQKFQIAYGGMLSNNRTFQVLFDALKSLKEKVEFEFIVYGNVENEFREAIVSNQLEDSVKIVSHLSHSEYIKNISEASCLLLLIDDCIHNEWIITGKIYEYMLLKKPILGIGPKGGDAEVILTESNSGVLHGYNDREQILSTLKNYYKYWENETSPFSFEIDKYSRKKQTEELSRYLNELIDA